MLGVKNKQKDPKNKLANYRCPCYLAYGIDYGTSQGFEETRCEEP